MRPRTTEIVCVHCRSVHSESGWKSLPAVSEVAASELARLASKSHGSDPNEVILVRACHCGGLLACPAPKRAPSLAPMPPIRSMPASHGEAFVWM